MPKQRRQSLNKQQSMSFLKVEIQYSNYKNNISPLSIATARGNVINGGISEKKTEKRAFMRY